MGKVTGVVFAKGGKAVLNNIKERKPLKAQKVEEEKQDALKDQKDQKVEEAKQNAGEVKTPPESGTE